MAERFGVRLTTAALADLDDLAAYRAEYRGLDDAVAMVERLRAQVATLDCFPLRGPVPQEMEGSGRFDIRQTMVAPTRIFDQVLGEEVAVFMFADGRRDIDALLATRLPVPARQR